MKPLQVSTRLSCGVGLVELMVAMTVGLALAAATIFLFVSTKRHYAAHRSQVSMLENGQAVARLLREDMRMAGYWGLNYRPSAITAEDVAIHGECAPDWATDATTPLEVLNNGNAPYRACIPNADYAAGTDVLTVRHAAAEPVLAEDIVQDRLYLYTSLTEGVLFQAQQDGAVNDSVEVTALPAEIYPVTVHTYYVRPWSLRRADRVPTLVREVLEKSATAAEPLAEFIEDLQISVGLDTDHDAVVDLYQTHGFGTGPTGNPLLLRIELLVRSPTPDPGQNRPRAYSLGDRNRQFEDEFRRIHIVDTVFLRNLPGRVPGVAM